MPRLFIAIDLPEAVKESLVLLQNGLRGARWVTRDNLHLTIRFIGEVSAEEAGEIYSVLGEVRAIPFIIKLGEIGVFSSRGKPRNVWIGVQDRSSIDTLKRQIDHSLLRLGINPEGRRYVPHVTLARLREKSSKLSDFLARLGTRRGAPVRVEQFVLFSSILAHTGAIYTPEVYYPLVSSRLNFERSAGTIIGNV